MINIVNYRVGNLQNIQNAFSTLGVSSQITESKLANYLDTYQLPEV